MKLRYDNEAIRRFCRERGVARLEFFGSALGDDFRPDSQEDLPPLIAKLESYLAVQPENSGHDESPATT